MQGYHKRSDYTFEEKRTILEYIISQKCYLGLRGNTFWQEMEARKVLQRTWQSLKEHFKKKIIHVLHIFDIPEEEKRLIREGWESSRVVKQDTNGRKVKRPRQELVTNEFSDEDNDNASKKKNKNNENDDYFISDDSDSSTLSFQKTESKGKRILKSRNNKKSKTPRSPSKFNVFSDEDEEMNVIWPPISLSIAVDSAVDNSPNLLAESRQNTTELPSTSKTNKIIPENTQKNKKTKKNASIQIDSDANEITIVHVPVKKSGKKKTFISNNHEKPSNEEFSLEEDMRLINFIKADKTYLQRRNQLSIYTYYQEIFPNSRPPKQLKDRFVNYIFPNIYKYTDLTTEEMCQIYKDAGVDIPNNLNALLQESPRNAVVQETNKDLEIDNCEDEININSINCIYCPILLNDQSHIFVSDLNKSSNQETVTALLSKKFKIAPEFIHHTDFASFYLLEQINKFRTSIYKQYENIITPYLQESCNNINLEEIISGLEICFQSFSFSDDEESENSDTSCESAETRNLLDNINTQNFNPKENSTPQKTNSGNISEYSESPFIIVTQIKQEIEIEREEYLSSFSSEHNYSAEIPEIEIKVEPELNFSDSTESLTIGSEHFEEKQQRLQQENRGNDSQYLQSISTQGSTDIRNAVSRIVADSSNHSIEFPASSEMYCTATNFSQDVR